MRKRRKKYTSIVLTTNAMISATNTLSPCILPILILITFLYGFNALLPSQPPNSANETTLSKNTWDPYRYLGYLSDEVDRPYLEISWPENNTNTTQMDMPVKRSLTLRCVSKSPILWITPISKDFYYSIIPFDKSAKTIAVNGTLLYVNNLRLSKLRYTHTGFYQCCDRDSKIDKSCEESSLSTCSRKIYIFANDIEHLIVPAKEQMPQNMVYIALVKNKPMHFPCKATYSNATVKLVSKRKFSMARHPFDPKRGFWIQAPSMKYHSAYDCIVTYENVTQRRMYMAIYKGMTLDPKPKIIKHNFNGKIPIHSNFSMECSVVINADDLVDMSWWIGDKKINNQYYNDSQIQISVSSETDTPSLTQMKKKTVFSNLNISNVEKRHENKYKCMVKDHIGKIGTDDVDIQVYDPFDEPDFSISPEEKLYPAQVINVTARGQNLLVPVPPLSPICTSRHFVCSAWGYPHPVINWYLEDFCDYQTNYTGIEPKVIINTTSPRFYLPELCNISGPKSLKSSTKDQWSIPRILVLRDFSGRSNHQHDVEGYKNSSWNISLQQIKISEHRHVIRSRIELDAVIKGRLICRAENSGGQDEKAIDIISLKDAIQEAGVETVSRYLGLIMSLLLAIGSFFLFVVLLITLSWTNNKKKATMGRKFRIPSLEKMCELTLFDPNDKQSKKSKMAMTTGVGDTITEFQFESSLEFPRNRLIMGRCLGEGAFGKVMEAEAFGLDGEDKSVIKVAIKMVKNDLDNSQLVSLISEFKIMITIGKHLNLVNLLGVCTGGLGEKVPTIMIIMEYCAHGNLRQHLINGRTSFDQKSLPLKRSVVMEIISEEEIYNKTLDQNDILYKEPMITSSISSKSKLSSCPKIYPSTSDRTTHNDDQCGNPFEDSPIIETAFGDNAPINSTHCKCRTLERLSYETLLCYAYQIAKGMEFLSSKNCLHRDLACRNVLLDHNNIIKICDFGLSKDMYRYSQYVKKTDGPVPIKWMAIESLVDNVYTIKSDVWSYGVVLWEIFSMGRTPYPGVELGNEFVKKLKDNVRLQEPAYSGVEMYDLMLKCWVILPEDRPNFHVITQNIAEVIESYTPSRSKNLTYDDLSSNYGYYKNLTQDYSYLPSVSLSKRFDEKQDTSNHLKLVSTTNPKSYNNSIFSVATSKTTKPNTKSSCPKPSKHNGKLSCSKLSLTKNISLESTVSTDSAFSNNDSSTVFSSKSTCSEDTMNINNHSCKQRVYTNYLLKIQNFYKSVSSYPSKNSLPSSSIYDSRRRSENSNNLA